MREPATPAQRSITDMHIRTIAKSDRSMIRRWAILSRTRLFVASKAGESRRVRADRRVDSPVQARAHGFSGRFGIERSADSGKYR